MYAIYGISLCLLLLLPGWHASTPLKIWCGSWTLSWLIHALLADVYFVSNESLFFVFLGNVLFAFGYVAYNRPTESSASIISKRSKAISAYLEGESIRIWCCYLLLFLSFASISLGASQMGTGIISAFRDGIFETMRIGKASLYDGDEYAIPSGIKLATAATSATSILAGLALASRPYSQRKIGWLYFILYFASVLLFSAISGVRSFILTAGLFFLFSFIAARTFLNHGRNVITLKAVSYATISVVVFLIWTVIVQSARLQDSSFQNLSGTLEHLRPWFGGYLPALSVWYEENTNGFDYAYGTHIFRGLLAPLGVVSGEGFNERIYFAWIGNGQASNAMTIFRSIWADFGPIGGSFFCFLWGITSSYIFHKAMNCGKHWIVILACNYCAIFFSINFWFFAHGSKPLAAVIASAVVYFSVKRFVWSSQKRRQRGA